MRMQGGRGSGLKSSQQESVTAVDGARCVIIAKGVDYN
jgi:hypothetical protein